MSFREFSPDHGSLTIAHDLADSSIKRINMLRLIQFAVVVWTALATTQACLGTHNDTEHRENAEMIFIGTLDNVVAGPVGLSSPPMRTHQLTFSVTETLRGDLPADENVDCSSVLRQNAEPVFPEGKICVVFAKKIEGRLTIIEIREANDAALADARTIVQYPMGWTIRDGNWFSPWESLGEKGWTAGTDSSEVCHATGRPALLVGSQIKLEISVVPPVKEIKWTNPDGDGIYKITVSNPTDHAIEVPALVTRDGNILWKESLVILCQDKAYPLHGAQGVTEGVSPKVLQAGESVSTEVNAFELEGPEWPRGGYRIEFQFCLGEKSERASFYYMSSHHDALRKQVQENLIDSHQGDQAKEDKEGDDPKALSGTLEIPAAEATFEGATAWVRLWEYDPFLADAAAREFADVQVEKIQHQNGAATRFEFELGDTEQINADRKYYVTVFLYRDGDVGNVKKEIFFLDGFNKVDLPCTLDGVLKKLDR